MRNGWPKKVDDTPPNQAHVRTLKTMSTIWKSPSVAARQGAAPQTGKPVTMEIKVNASSAEFPALSPVVAAPPKPLLNFKKTVEAAAARIEEAAVAAPPPKPMKKKVSFTDLEFEEYEEEEEFNANLIGNRRRGDKGLW